MADLTPREYIRQVRASGPDAFIPDPFHQMPGPNTRFLKRGPRPGP